MNEAINILDKHMERRTLWLSTLVACYYLLDLYLRTTDSPQLFVVWVGLGYVIFFSSLLFRKKISTIYLCLTLFLVLSMLVCSLFTANIQLLGILFNVHYVGIAYVLLVYNLNAKVISVLVYSYIAFFLYQIFLAVDPNRVFLSSRNLISAVMLNIMVIYYLTIDKNGKKIRVLPLFFSLVISVWSVSRSAIVAISFLCLGIVIVSLFKKRYLFGERQSRRKLLVTLFVGIVSLAVIISAIFLFQKSFVFQSIFDNARANLEVLRYRLRYESLISSSRLGILTSYLDEISSNPKYLLFGVELDSTQAFLWVSNNVHSSFLTAHVYYGLTGFLGLCLMILLTIAIYLKKRKWLYLILFGTVLIRISTDIIAFPGYMDSVIYFFILDGLNGYFRRVKPIQTTPL